MCCVIKKYAAEVTNAVLNMKAILLSMYDLQALPYRFIAASNPPSKLLGSGTAIFLQTEFSKAGRSQSFFRWRYTEGLRISMFRRILKYINRYMHILIWHMLIFIHTFIFLKDIHILTLHMQILTYHMHFSLT